MKSKGGRGNRKLILRDSRTHVVFMLLLITMLGSGWTRAAEKAVKPAEPSALYVAKRGDSLYSIASQYLLEPASWVAVMRFNHLTSNRLKPGTRLQLPVALLRQESTSAHVIATSGPAERAFGSGPFIPLLVDMVLTAGDRIRTGHNGFVTLETWDGSHISVPPQSTITISALQRTVLTGTINRVIKLERGEVDSEVTHATKKGDRFQIRSPSVVAGVRGTRFRVAYNADHQTTAVEVLDGTVAVTPAADAAGGAADEQFVHARFGNITRSMDKSTVKVGNPIELLVAPTLIAPGKTQTENAVTFDLVPLDGARGYRLQIGRDAGMLDLIGDVRVDVPHAMFDALADGTYFVRASANDSNGLEGLPKIYAFERRQLDLDASANRRPGTRDYVFQWRVSRTGVATHFRFVLAAAPDMRNPIVDQVDIEEGRTVITNLPSGEYYWTVIAEQFENGKLYQKASAVSSFTLAY